MGARVDFNETYTHLMNEKEARAIEASKRARESNKEAQALLSGLNQFIQARRLDRSGVESLDPTTVLVKKGGEALRVSVNEPGKYTVKLFVGEPFATLDNVGEDEMKREIVQWLCSEVAEPSTRR
jgi:hypothetical protein